MLQLLERAYRIERLYLVATGIATSAPENPEKLLDRGRGVPTLGKKLALGIGATFFGLSGGAASLVFDLPSCPVLGPGSLVTLEGDAGSGWPWSEKVIGTGLNEVLRSTCVCPYTVVALILALTAANASMLISDIDGWVDPRGLAEMVDCSTSEFEDIAS
jgi:hypothetical protein